MSDSTLDNQPRQETFTFQGRRIGSIHYAYLPTGELQATSAGGIDATSGMSWNPNGTVAYVVPPYSSVRNTPLDSVQIRLSAPLAGLTLSHLNFEGLTPAGLTLTPNADNTIYTLSGMAAQQTSDGRYAVKLLALNSGLGSSFIGSTGVSWTLDRAAPVMSAALFNQDGPTPTPLSFTFRLNETVAAAGSNIPMQLRRQDGSLADTVLASLSPDGLEVVARRAAPLPDGRYVAVVPGGSVRDHAGNLVVSELQLPFFIMAGDADHDGSVGFSDLLALARNYGTLGKTFSQGNFNYDAEGRVGFDDLLILARAYGTSLVSTDLPTEAAALTAPVKAGTDARRRRPGVPELE